MRFIEIACSFGLVIMFHFNHFRNLADAKNRFFLHWSSDYAIKFIFFLCLHTLLIYLSYLIIKKIKPVLVKPVFLFVSWYFFLYALLGTVVPPIDFSADFSKIAGSYDLLSLQLKTQFDNKLNVWWAFPYLIPFLLFLIYHRSRPVWLFSVSKFMTCIWATIGLSLSVGLFFYPYRGYMVKDIKEVKNITYNKNKTPVFIFLFDNWSGPRINLAQIQKKFPNLQELISQSNFYRFSFSPNSATLESIPSLIFQKPFGFKLNEKEGTFVDKKSNFKSTEIESLFTFFKNKGYYTAIVGNYHPYPLLINDEDVDVMSSYPPYGPNLLTATLFIMYRSLSYASDPIIRPLADPAMRISKTYQKYLSDHDMLENVYYATREWNGSVFAFFHLMVNHSPFIYKEDGSLITYKPDALNSLHSKSASEDYEQTLQYTDSIIGNIIKNLQTNGMFDRSMLVFLSDHNWKWDRRFWGKEWWNHVPLIIKHPYQKKGKIITEQVLLSEFLQPMFRTYFNK